MPLKVSSESASAIFPAMTERWVAASSEEVGVLTIMVYGRGPLANLSIILNL